MTYPFNKAQVQMIERIIERQLERIAFLQDKEDLFDKDDVVMKAIINLRNLCDFLHDR